MTYRYYVIEDEDGQYSLLDNHHNLESVEDTVPDALVAALSDADTGWHEVDRVIILFPEFEGWFDSIPAHPSWVCDELHAARDGVTGIFSADEG